MIICGIKLTHDAAVALIDDGHLVFSVEMEKLDNNPRYRALGDLCYVRSVLANFGYRVEDVDRFVVDGWHENHGMHLVDRRLVIEASLGDGAARVHAAGEAFRIDIAPYRYDGDLLRPTRAEALGRPYLSYSHYSGHVAGGYASSPFARTGHSAYVLCWDGAMLPFLYHVDGATRKVREVAQLSSLLGKAYFSLAMTQPPFDAPIAFPKTLGLSGKIMAYVALGRPDERVIDALEALYSQALEAMFGTEDPPREERSGGAGHGILEHMRAGLPAVRGDTSAEDMIASIHEFLGRRLVGALHAAIEDDGMRSPKLCLVGGCALNIKWNREIRSRGFVEEVWVPPFPNDAGSAIGAACCELLRTGGTLEWNVYSGPELQRGAIPPGWSERPCSLHELAERLHRRPEPVLYLDGRAELGPRALGHRSILAPATDAAMKDTLNAIKLREAYRPVAPICRADRAPDVFDPGLPDPFMLFDHHVRADWRDRVPAVCHLDGSARLQTVTADQEPRVFALLTEYERLSGIPLLCNTSANDSGCGFFPDLASAMRWGRVSAVWSDATLYERQPPERARQDSNL